MKARWDAGNRARGVKVRKQNDRMEFRRKKREGNDEQQKTDTKKGVLGKWGGRSITIVSLMLKRLDGKMDTFCVEGQKIG